MSQIIRRLGFAGLLVLFVITPVLARDVEIAWDANPEPEVAGYIVRYGTTPGVYDVSIDVGNRTNWTLTALQSRFTYYVAVEAYSADGLRSALSTEITIEHEGVACSSTLSTTSASMSASGAAMTVAVTALPECSWSARSLASWITIVSGSSNIGRATVMLNVASNMTLSARLGVVQLDGHSFTVTQAAGTCAMPVQSSLAFNRGGGSGIIDVAASSEACGWTVTTNVGWLTLAGGSSRQGSGTVNFRVAANDTAGPRSGRVVVAGHAISVTQIRAPRTQALDLDGSGTGDLFLYNGASGEWARRLWNGSAFVDGGTGVMADGWTVLPADFNGDERSDLFLYNPSDGMWRKAISATNGRFYFYGSRWTTGWTPLVADFNGDGRSDVFLYNKQTGQWFECITQTTTTEFAYSNGQWAAGLTIHRASLNGDNRDDLFLYNANAPTVDENGGKWFQAVTQPDLNFSYVAGSDVWPSGLSITPADFNADGRSELFLYGKDGQWTVASFVNGSISYRRGQWTTGFQIDRAEFNGDGRADLFMYNPFTGQWFAVVTQPGGTFSYVPGAWPKGYDVEVTDLDGNGISDLVVFNRTRGFLASVKTLRPGAFESEPGTFPQMWQLFASHVILP
jgi:hypothetical protein